MHTVYAHRAPRAFHRHLMLAICGLALGSATVASACGHGKPKDGPPFSALYVFGDSLSDTGNLFAGTGHQAPPAELYWNGHSSNGLLWPEYVASALGLRYNQATNFAWAGATTGTFNAWEPDFQNEALPGMQDELAAFLGTLGPDGADPEALYVVFGGANDFFTITQENAEQVITNALTNIASVVATLHAVGAEHIVVVNLPDIGLTPRAMSGGPEAAAMATYLSNTFNVGLAGALDKLAAAGIETMRVDVFALLNEMVDHPRKYGFTNVTEPSFPDYVKGRTHLFWDPIHPTTRAQAWMAVEILEAVRDADLIRHRPGLGYFGMPPRALGWGFGRR